MKIKILNLFSLFLLMLITGVFWGTWFTMTRSIESFTSEEFIHIGKVIIQNVAVPMRIIVPSGILLMVLSLVFYKNKRAPAFYTGLTSLILLVLVLLITLLVLVPIDNQIKEWSTANLPQNWQDIRSTWKEYHALRTFASLASFAFFSYFIITGLEP